MVNLLTLVGTSFPRTVAPLFPDLAWRLPQEERIAYLTFDDGPNPELTARLADILDRFGAKGTFFLLGARAQRHPDLVRALAESGHTIGNHTYSHPDAWRSSRLSVIRELERTTRVLENVGGRRIRWMRPPFGHFTPAMRKWCVRRGQRLTMWDIGTGDYLDSVSKADIERHVATYIRRGSIIVLHDNPCCADVTPDAVEGILDRLTGEGWRFTGLPDGQMSTISVR